jgi:Sulfatase
MVFGLFCRSESRQPLRDGVRQASPDVDEEVICGGGGIWHAPHYFGNGDMNESYLNNGKWQKYHEYSTDIQFDQAMKFTLGAQNRNQSFFCYLATTAPHVPFWCAGIEL